MLKLWGRPTSACTQKVLWTCHEAGLRYDLTLASATMGPGGSVERGHAPYGVVDTPAYAALNPNRTVPTLDDEGLVLWESNTIVRYLAQRHAPWLYGGDERGLALASQWMDWEPHVGGPLHTLILQCSRLPDAERSAAALREMYARMERPLEILSAQLSRHPYLAGESFSLADISVGTQLARWYIVAHDRPDVPAVAAWIARLAQRPAYRAHLADPAFHI